METLQHNSVGNLIASTGEIYVAVGTLNDK